MSQGLDYVANKGEAKSKQWLRLNFLTSHIRILFVCLIIKVLAACVQWPFYVWTEGRLWHLVKLT